MFVAEHDDWRNVDIMGQLDEKILVRLIRDTYCFARQGEEGGIRSNARNELKKRIRALAHIVETQSTFHPYACKHCGSPYSTDDYFAMEKHGDTESCANKFSHRQCYCGKEFDNLQSTWEHRCNHLTQQRNKEETKKRIQERIKKQEEQYKRKIEKMRIYNANRKPVAHCDVCDVDFLSKYDEERHMKGREHIYKADPSKRPNHHCATCNSTFLSRKQMETHLQTRKHLKLNPPHSTTHTPPPQSPVCVPSQPSCSVSLQ